MGRFEDARDSIIDGLQFEPEDKVGAVGIIPLS